MPKKTKGEFGVFPENEPVRNKKGNQSNRFLGFGKRKFSPETITTRIAEFIKHALNEDNQTLCTRANFIVWQWQTYEEWVSEETLMNYSREENYRDSINSLMLVQRAQLESRSVFSVLGAGSVMALMLKNVGYQDKVVNEFHDETLFEAVIDKDAKGDIDVTKEE